jgi:hypothetical protein
MTQAVWPWLQLSMHVAEHAAFGAFPEQDCDEVHVDVEDTYQHPSVSFMQVATVCMSWQTVPCWEHAVATQAQDAVPDALVQVWLVPHVVVVTHCVQPLAPSWHFCTASLEHCVLPALQTFTHPAASPPSVRGAPVSGAASEEPAPTSGVASPATVESARVAPSSGVPSEGPSSAALPS